MKSYQKNFAYSQNYHPRLFISRFTIILTIFFLITSIVIVHQNYKEHRNLLIVEKNDELDLLVSLLDNSFIVQQPNHLQFIEIWIKGHPEIKKIILSNTDGTILKSFANSQKPSSTLYLKRNIHLPKFGNIVLGIEFNISKHDRNFLRLAIELFGVSLFIAIIFGLFLYTIIYKYAINPLQKEFLKEFNINETILSNLQLGIALIDNKLNVLKANTLIKQWYMSYSDKELKTCYTCQSVIGEKLCQECPVVKTFQDGHVHETTRSLLIAGEIVYQRIMAYPVFSENQVTQVIEIVEDITKRVSDEEKFRRAYRVQKILSQCIQVLIHSENENALLQNICQIIVDSGFYKLAWIGLINFDDKSIVPASQAGFDDGFFYSTLIKFDDSDYGNNPVGQAIKNNLPQLIQDIESDLSANTWKTESIKRGFNSMLCIPLRDEILVIGTLNVFAEQKYVINEEEMNLLIKLADEISYGMHVFRTKKNSQLLIESNINLRQDRDEATIANRKKSDFLAVITHEIRTPLTGILGMTELLLRSSINNEQEKYLNIIKSTAYLQMNIINDILDLSKIENGKLILEKSIFNLRHLIEEVTRSFEWQVQQKNLNMIISYEADIPENFTGDSLRIKQIFYNLIGNAVKFTEHGYIKILVEKKYQDSQICKLKISIIDSGIGIPLEKQSRIFESYIQADASISKKYGGTGLGTTITKRLVELMGGTIGLQSPARDFKGIKTEKNPGSEFWFILDLFISSIGIDEAGGITVDKDMHSRHPDLKARILVAEDNEVNQTLIQIMLERMGHSVDIVKNGLDAIEKIKENQYDIIFMDIEMPELNGLDTVRILRGDLQIKIPVIALTANAYLDDIKNYMANGMDDIISKPYNQDEIINRIDKWFYQKNDF